MCSSKFRKLTAEAQRKSRGNAEKINRNSRFSLRFLCASAPLRWIFKDGPSSSRKVLIKELVNFALYGRFDCREQEAELNAQGDFFAFQRQLA